MMKGAGFRFVGLIWGAGLWVQVCRAGLGVAVWGAGRRVQVWMRDLGMQI